MGLLPIPSPRFTQGKKTQARKHGVAALGQARVAARPTERMLQTSATPAPS